MTKTQTAADAHQHVVPLKDNDLGRRIQARFAGLGEIPIAPRQPLRQLDGASWDAQIASDFKAGKLDKLIAKAQAEMAAGRVKSL
jgi:hypothetical protein